MGERSNDQKGGAVRPPVRRPYQTPRLVRLGTLTEMTAHINSMNGDADSVHSGHKTAA